MSAKQWKLMALLVAVLAFTIGGSSVLAGPGDTGNGAIPR